MFPLDNVVYFSCNYLVLFWWSFWVTLSLPFVLLFLFFCTLLTTTKKKKLNHRKNVQHNCTSKFYSNKHKEGWLWRKLLMFLDISSSLNFNPFPISRVFLYLWVMLNPYDSLAINKLMMNELQWSSLKITEKGSPLRITTFLSHTITKPRFFLHQKQNL